MEQNNLQNLYDVVIIGGGPAGLTAALYLARARYRVIVVEKERFGGQITITSEVVNYPGVERTDGIRLTETMQRQAQNFGAEFSFAEVTGLEMEGDVKTVRTTRGELRCFGVLLASGAHPRVIGFTGEEDFRGRGVAYCATCDGEFFTGKEVFVIGGGFAAAEESVFLTKYARHVTILIREDDFTCARATAEAARSHEKITVLTHIQVEEVSGGSAVESIRYRNTQTGEVTRYVAEEGDTIGVFVFAGYVPETALVQGLAELDPHGYVITDRCQKTTVDGLYAAGDVCVKNLRQVVTAVGDGALAATELEKYAAAMQQRLDLHPVQRAEPVAEPASAPEEQEESTGLLSPEIRAQLKTVFSKMAHPLILQIHPDERPVSAELEAYMRAIAEETDRLTVEMAADSEEPQRPFVRILREDRSDTGLAFHGVPGGHEFTSFVLGLYNAAGPGQPLDPQTEQQIRALDRPVMMRILVSLSCTMCPELVTAAQRIASLNPNVRAEVYDLNHFGELKEKYNVMSVPCMVIHDDQVLFGKKSIPQLLEILQKQ